MEMAATVNRRPGTPVRRVVGAAALALGVIGMTAAPSSADVVVGQRIETSNLRCGGQERITGEATVGLVPFRQRAWIYYNCSDSTHRREAGLRGFRDLTPCKAIPPKQAIVLNTLWAVIGMPSQYSGSEAC